MGEFYISYTKDIKFIYTKFTLDFTEEKNFLKEKIENEIDEYKKSFLLSKIKEFELLEKIDNKNLTFYYVMEKMKLI